MAHTLMAGALVTVTPDKPAAGGRMIARHEGLVLLVSGAIPGEPVRVRVERVERSLAFAQVVEVLDRHPSRRPCQNDPRCGGAVFAHVSYPEQLRLKGDIIRDGLVRLGRIDPPPAIPVMASPEQGYRMRARLHLRTGRVGFFLEGTHQLCDAAATNQLLPATMQTIEALAGQPSVTRVQGDADLDVSENVTGDQRAVHLDLSPDASAGSLAGVTPVTGMTGLSWSRRGVPGEHVLLGHPFVEDVIAVRGTRPEVATRVGLRRHARAFFQGNRYLLSELVSTVLAACTSGLVIDLYAGVGLFGVCLAAAGDAQVVAVESHPASAADLRVNAQPYGAAITVHEMAVERFVEQRAPSGTFTLVLDPPRSGMSKPALAGALRLAAARIVFVSCDVATFARDVARLVAAGYSLESVTGFDLFPTTAHVEMVAVLSR